MARFNHGKTDGAGRFLKTTQPLTIKAKGLAIMATSNSIPITNPAAGLVTVQHDFLNATRNGDKLFSVRAGVPMSDAFDQLTLLLAAAHSAVEGLAVAGNTEDGPDAHWAAVHVLSFAYELAQSMHGGIPRAEPATRLHQAA